MQEATSKTSSDKLIHFVEKEEYLIQILNHNFYPRLCREDLIKPLFKSDVHVPMKCFCDIPLESLEEHMKTYGQYGVGFKKSWGERIGLTPVIYYNDKSPYIDNVKAIYNDYIRRLKDSHRNSDRLDEDIKNPSISEMLRILKSSFTMYKPIKGKYTRRPEYGNYYLFYEEREWRYLLSATEYTAYLQGDNLDKETIDFYNGVEKNGKWKKGKLEEYQIDFTYDDIDFIIVPPDCDKNNIIESITVSQNNKIKSKITTLEILIEKEKEK